MMMMTIPKPMLQLQLQLRQYRARILMICVCVLSLSSVQASAQERDPLLDIQEITTDKGIDIWLIEDNTIPIISMKFAFQDAGSANETIATQGLARLTSSMMTQGAGEIDATAFQKELTDKSIALSFGAGRDHFQGSLKTLSKNSDRAFEMLALALSNPRFDDADLQRLVKSNQSRIRSSQSDPKWMAARITNDIVFDGHPYALNSGGTLSSLASITTADLRAFKDSKLGKNNLVIAVTGQIDADTIKQKIDAVFGGLPDVDVTPVAPFASQHQGQSVLYNQDIPQSVVAMYHPGIASDDPEYFNAQVLNYIFGGSGFGSRLMEEIREKRGLTYGIYSSLQNLDAIALLKIGTSTKNDTLGEMTDTIREEFIRVRNKGVTQEELDAAKAYLTGSLPLSLTSTDKVSGLMLSLLLDGRPADYLDIRQDALNAMQVSDLSALAKKWFDPDAFTTIIVGNPSQNFIETLDDSLIHVDTLPNVE